MSSAYVKEYAEPALLALQLAQKEVSYINQQAEAIGIGHKLPGASIK